MGHIKEIYQAFIKIIQ